MAVKLKVWGGLIFVNGKQVRTIVATKYKKDAISLFDYMSIHEFNNYWCETGNDIELKVALSKPNTVFVATSSMGNDFHEL